LNLHLLCWSSFLLVFFFCKILRDFFNSIYFSFHCTSSWLGFQHTNIFIEFVLKYHEIATISSLSCYYRIFVRIKINKIYTFFFEF
jgi:hypothetical protein